MSHIVIPCEHIFALWKYLGNDLMEMMNRMINKHWDIAYHRKNHMSNLLSPQKSDVISNSNNFASQFLLSTIKKQTI